MRYSDQSLVSVLGRRATVLIFGGVTLEGFENALRLAHYWNSLDRGVVWFDGFPDEKPARPQTEGLFVIDYGERERDRWLNRLERRRTGKISSNLGDSPIPETDSRAMSGPSDATTTVAYTADRFLTRFLKRWNTATRGYSNWRLIRGEVLALSERLTPTEIVYCDDHALTSAWHAARLWPATHVTRSSSS